MRFIASKCQTCGFLLPYCGAVLNSAIASSITCCGRMFSSRPRLHRVDLLLRGALGVVEQVEGLGDRRRDGRDAVARHHQDLLVADDAGEPLALGRIERRPAIAVVVGGVHRDRDFGLADRQDALVLQPRQRARERHVGVEHRAGVLREAMDRRVDAVAGALDVALAGEPLAVIADFHEAACRHLGPVEAERDLVVAVVRARHAEGQVIEDALVEARASRRAGARRRDRRAPASARFRGRRPSRSFPAASFPPVSRGLSAARFRQSRPRRSIRVAHRSDPRLRSQSGLKFIATPLMQ